MMTSAKAWAAARSSSIRPPVPPAATSKWSAWKNSTPPEEIAVIYSKIKKHADYTKSQRAFKALALWEDMIPKFVKVMPKITSACSSR